MFCSGATQFAGSSEAVSSTAAFYLERQGLAMHCISVRHSDIEKTAKTAKTDQTADSKNNI